MEKALTEYYKSPGTKDGHRGECIECSKAQRKAWYDKNSEVHIARAKKWQEENREKLLEWQRKYRETNREWMREKDRRRWLANKYGLTPERFDELLENQAERVRSADGCWAKTCTSIMTTIGMK